jgi:NADH:ubiquinone oxidoreductase subunit 5 (subunit L)/multisubunit Na+/H+ antiporter MnhA subunit
MEEQLKKLRTRAIITFILSLLALTWQFLNYLSIKDYLIKDLLESNSSTLMVYLSYIFFIVLFLSIILLTFTSFRVSMKYKSEKRKEIKAAEKAQKELDKKLLESNNTTNLSDEKSE